MYDANFNNIESRNGRVASKMKFIVGWIIAAIAMVIGNMVVNAKPAEAATVMYNASMSPQYTMPSSASGAPTAIYAAWKANQYTVTLNSNRGSIAASSAGTSSVKATYNYAMPTITIPTITGYTFAGYWSGSGGTGTQYYNASGGSYRSWNLTSNTTLYAKWNLNTYTVVYNKNATDAINTMSNSTYTVDSAKALTANAFTQTGYTFKYWTHYIADSGAKFYNGDTLLITPNGSYISLKNQTNTSNVISSATIASGNVINLYAQWEANTYWVAFNANGGSGSMTNQSLTYGVSSNLKTNTLTRTGYSFSGWCSTASSSASGAKTFTNGQSVQPTDLFTTAQLGTNGSTATLYAQWTAQSQKLTFDDQASWHASDSSVTTTGTLTTKGPGTLSLLYDSSLPSTLSSQPVRVGYDFGGYYTSSGGSGTQWYNASGSRTSSAGNSGLVNWTGTKTIYAKWTPRTYQVYTVVNNGTDSTKTQQANATFDKNFTAPSCPSGYAKTGYHFDHWNTKTDNSGVSYNVGANILNLVSSPAANTASIGYLYAVWSANTYYVKFNANGGTGSMSNQTHTYDKALALTANSFTKVGYSFTGWATTESGAVAYANQASVKNLTTTNGGTVNLYAKWGPQQYTVTLNSNLYKTGTTVFRSATNAGGTSVKATYDADMPLTDVSGNTLLMPKLTGYKFDGYYDTIQYLGATASGNKYYNGMTAYNQSPATSAKKWNKTANTTLYARWVPKTYAITFQDGSGTVGTASFTVTSTTATYDQVLPSVASPTKSGYTFAGYYTAATGGTKYYNGTTTSTPGATVAGCLAWTTDSAATLYAHWSANTYTVTFDVQGGTGGTAQTTATYGSSLPSVSIPSKTGYVFGGYWTKSGGAGTQYWNQNGVGISGKYYDIAGNTTMYAYWSAAHSETTLDSNLYDASGNKKKSATNAGTTKVTAIYDSAMPTPVTAPTLAGYTFQGYYDNKNGQGNQYYKISSGTISSARNWDKTGAVTLYAKWQANTYKITFDKQSGTGGTDSISVTSDTTVSSITSPTRTGYIFKGYYSSTDSTATQYFDGSGVPTSSISPWTGTASITAYAQWKPISYTVSFNANGGSGSLTSLNCSYGSSYTLPKVDNTSSTMYYTGRTFKGWATSASGAVSYSNAASISNLSTTEGASIVLYAQWKVNEYTIVYNKNATDATGTTASSKHTYDVPKTLTANGFSRVGYTFSGWSTTSSGSVQYGNQQSVSNLTTTPDGTVNLYAVWTPITYTVRYNKNATDATGTMASTSHTYNQAKNLSAIAFSRVGYTAGDRGTNNAFTGTNVWTASGIYSGGTQPNYADKQSVKNLSSTNNATVDLYVNWTPNQYTITFDNQGATTAGTTSATATYDAAVPAITTPTRTGYEFAGYYTATNGGGTKYYTNLGTAVSGSVWKIAANTTLYAKWENAGYTVTLDSSLYDASTNAFVKEANSAGTTSVAVVYDNPLKTITTPALTGYVFKGYFLEKNGASTQYYNADGTYKEKWNIASNRTLYAKWDAISYKIRYNAPTKTSGTMSDSTHTYDIESKLTTNAFVKTGYSFAGWATDSTSKTVVYSNGASVKNLSSIAGDVINLYALWTPLSYTVTLNNMGATTPGTTSVSATYDAALPSITCPAKTGYTFYGYFDNSDFSLSTTKQYYKADGTYYSIWDKASNATLYAKWNPNTYTVKFDKQNGTGGTDTISIVYATTAANYPAVSAPTRNGYTFGGYYTSTGGAGNAYFDASCAATRTWDIAANTTLYAKWTANTIKITLNANGGAVGTQYVYYKYGTNKFYSDSACSTAITAISIPTRTGYTFTQYSGDGTCGGTAGKRYIYAAGTFADDLCTDIYKNATLTAQWSANTYTVTLDGQGATTAGTSSVSATFGQAMPTTVNGTAVTMPKKTGYTFGGYYSKTSGAGNQYYNAAGQSARTWNIAANTTLYANWVPNPTTVTLDANLYNAAGTEVKKAATNAGTATVTAIYGNSMPLTESSADVAMPTLTGYDFGGYWSAKNGSGTKYYEAMSYGVQTPAVSAHKWDSANTTTTLYAKWTAKAYSITLNKQGGSGGTDTVNATYDTTLPSISVPSYTGYLFQGYYEAVSASGTQYYTSSGTSSYVWTGDYGKTIYAAWNPITYYVRYNGNGSTSGSMSDSTHTYGVQKALTANAFSRTGYTFEGWGKNTTTVNPDYKNGATVLNLSATDKGVVTIYAIWSANTYTIAYDANGGTGSMAATTHVYDVAKTLTANAFTRTGYTFKNWNTAKNGTGTQYANSASVKNLASTKGATVTMYAQWTANTYQVTLDQTNATTTGTTSVTATYDSAMPTSGVSMPLRTGYTLKGYYSGENGAGTQYYGQMPYGSQTPAVSARTYNIASNTTLYPYWLANTYTVTLNAVNATSTSHTKSVTVTYDKAMTSITLPVRSGYTFAGYWTEANGKGTQYYTNTGASARNWDRTSDTTLTAYWTSKSYTVTLDSALYNSSSTKVKDANNKGTTSISAVFDNPMPEITVPALTGYIFGGYWSTKGGTGTQYYTDLGESYRSWNIDSTTATLYAKWTPITYIVQYNANGGTGTTASSPHTYDVAKTLTANGFTRTGYTFDGWAKSASGSKAFNDSQSVSNLTATNGATVNLYAKWTPNSYSITFSAPDADISLGTETTSATFAAAMPTITVPQRTGYLFDGYYYDIADSTTRYYLANGTSAKAWDRAYAATLSATWKARTYSIALDSALYNADGTQNKTATLTGSTTASPTYDAAMPAITAPQLTGYAFGGYWTVKGGTGTQYYAVNGSSMHIWDIPNNTTTLYAKWTANDYTVVLDNQGATVAGTSQVSATYDKAMPAITCPQKTGYTLNGFFTEKNGSGFQYYTGAGASAKNWDRTQNTRLYASWTANSYTVTFDRQGGTGGSGSASVTFDSPMPSIAVPTKTGYIFGGYYAETLGSGTKYYTDGGVSNTNWNLAKNATLYAAWTSKAYTVTLDSALYDSAGSYVKAADSPAQNSLGEKSVQVIYDNPLPSIITPTLIGYTFDGFWAGKNGTGQDYYDQDGASVRNWDVDSATTIYAKWVANTYTVKYNGNTNTGGTTSSSIHTYDVSKELTANGYTKTGYSFAGWATSSNGAIAYNDKATVINLSSTPGAVFNLYAKWTPNKYTVTFNNQNADVSTPGTLSAQVTYDAAMSAITCPKRTGYTFYGYFTSTNGAGIQYYQSDGTFSRTWNRAQDTTLYASWKANTYTVSLDPALYNASGTFIKSSTSTGTEIAKPVYDSDMPAIKVPTLTGYTFGGYWTGKSGVGTQYYASSGSSARKWNIANSSTTLYAKWTANTYSVTLNNQGADASYPGTASVIATYDSPMPAITCPQKTGYTFAGYYSELSADNQYYSNTGTSTHIWDKTVNTTLYAKWTANVYTVKFDMQGGTGGTTSTNATFGSDMPNIVCPTKTGYIFAGYYYAAGGQGTKYYTDTGASAHVWDIATENVTLYAQWQNQPYDVTLDSALYGTNGSKIKNADSDGSNTSGADTFKVVYDNPMPEIIAPELTGYTFGGYWSAKNGSGTQYYTGAPSVASARTWNIDGNATLYAKWTANTYTLTLDRQGGTGGSATATATYDQTLPNISVPGRTGYIFGGYWTSKNGAGTQMYETNGTSSVVWTQTSSRTLYAKWTAITYEVHYDANGGEGDMANTIHTYDVAKNLTAIGYLRTGYTFQGWATSASSKVVSYGNAASVKNLSSTQGAIVNIYAVWQANTYTIVYNGNGATSGSMANTTHTYDLASPLANNAFSRTGYTFDGWNTKDNGSGTAFANKATVMNLASASGSVVNLYAQWAANSYTVTLSASDADISKGTESVTAVYASALPAITNPRRTGYTFAGYNLSEDGTGLYYYNANGSSERAWDIASDKTLYAQWTANTYTVSFDGQGATTAGTGAVTATYDAAMPSITLPLRIGYTFGGYFSSTNAQGNQYYSALGASMQTWDIPRDTTLYAAWTTKSFRTTLDSSLYDVDGKYVKSATADAYDKNGSTVIDTVYDNPLPDITAPVLTGYTFGGFFLDKNGEGKQYYTAAGKSYADWDIDGARTLFAKWTANTYEVHYDANSGTGTMVNSQHTYDVPKNLSENLFTKTGYSFAGWATEADAPATYADRSEVVNLVSEQDGTYTLYAKWTANKYTVTLDNQSADSGLGGTDKVTATYDSDLPTITTPQKTGYTFAGYYTGVEGAGNAYYLAAGTSARKWDLTYDATLYAKWTPNKYTVTLDSALYDATGSVKRPATTTGSLSVQATFASNLPGITVPTLNGYTFAGYYAVKGGSDTQYYNEQGVSLCKWTVPSDTTIYAKWNANQYQITLNNQGATAGKVGTKYVTATYDALLPSITSPQKTGYTFGGYWKGKDGTGKQYYAADGAGSVIWDLFEDTTLYAKWTANKYTVMLNNQSADAENPGTSSVIATYDSPMPNILTPQRYGYIFGGYYTDTSGGGTKYYTANGSSANIWKIASDATLFAAWTASTYTVTLDPNLYDSNNQRQRWATTNGTDSVSVVFDNPMPVITPPTLTGYTFGGYYAAMGGSGTKYYSDTGSSEHNWNINSSMTIYAKWIPNIYSVKYEANGADSGTMDNTSHTYDVEAALRANAYTKVGYTFGGWATTQNGAAVYADKAKVSNLSSISGDIVYLYAHWEANHYTVTLNNQGADSGKEGDKSVTATYDSHLPTITCPERTGYTFSGYFTGVGGAGTQYYTAEGTSARIWNLPENKTLYAKWSANRYTVILDSSLYTDDGTAKISDAYFTGDTQAKPTYDSSMPTIVAPVLHGYTFGGYWTGKTGTGTQYYDSAGVSTHIWDIPNSDQTLYAKWTANKYTILLDSNLYNTETSVRIKSADTFGTTSLTGTYAKLLSNIIPPTLTGYRFQGYYGQLGGSGTQYLNADGTATTQVWNIANSATLYAQWLPNTYTIRFDGNGADSGSVLDSICTYDIAKAAPANGFYRQYYTFQGWNTKADGSGASYAVDDPMINLTSEHEATVYLYAQWKRTEWLVTFDANGGTGAPETQIKTIDVPLTLSNIAPTRDQYDFAGWGTSADATEAAYMPGDTYTQNDFLNLYAIWSERVAPAPVVEIVGTGRVDQTASLHFISEPEHGSNNYTYQWQYCDTANGVYQNISGATQSTFTPGTAYFKKYLRCVINVSNTYYYKTTTGYTEAYGPIIKGEWTIDGALSTLAPKVNADISITLSHLAPAGVNSYDYTWYYGDDASGWTQYATTTASSSTTDTSLIPYQAYNKKIKVVVESENTYYEIETLTRCTTSNTEKGDLSALVIVSDNHLVGETVTCTVSNLVPGAAPQYQWIASDSVNGTYTAISGATSSSYTLTLNELNKYIRCQITDANGYYSGTIVSSNYTGPVAQPTAEPIYNLKNTRNSDTKNTLTWSLGSNAAIAYDGYHIYRQTDYDSASWVEVTNSISGGTSTYADNGTSTTDPMTAHRYRYMVAPYNASSSPVVIGSDGVPSSRDGDLNWCTSNWTYNTPPAATNFTFVRNSEFDYTFEWDLDSDIPDIYTYTYIERSVDGGEYQAMANFAYDKLDSGHVVWHDTTTSGGHTYSYRVYNMNYSDANTTSDQRSPYAEIKDIKNLYDFSSDIKLTLTDDTPRMGDYFDAILSGMNNRELGLTWRFTWKVVDEDGNAVQNFKGQNIEYSVEAAYNSDLDFVLDASADQMYQVSTTSQTSTGTTKTSETIDIRFTPLELEFGNYLILEVEDVSGTIYGTLKSQQIGPVERGDWVRLNAKTNFNDDSGEMDTLQTIYVLTADNALDLANEDWGTEQTHVSSLSSSNSNGNEDTLLGASPTNGNEIEPSDGGNGNEIAPASLDDESDSTISYNGSRNRLAARYGTSEFDERVYYQWYALEKDTVDENGQPITIGDPIAGATSASYDVSTSYAGYYIYCLVTVEDYYNDALWWSWTEPTRAVYVTDNVSGTIHIESDDDDETVNVVSNDDLIDESLDGFQWKRQVNENGNISYENIEDADSIDIDPSATGYALLTQYGTLVSCDSAGVADNKHLYKTDYTSSSASDPDKASIRYIIIENGVTEIPQDAFRDCTGVSNIVIPESVSSIGDRAFMGCKALQSVTLQGDEIKELGENAFDGSSCDDELLTIYAPSVSKALEYRKSGNWQPYAPYIQSVTGETVDESAERYLANGTIYTPGTLEIGDARVTVDNATTNVTTLTSALQMTGTSKVAITGGTTIMKTANGNDIVIDDLYSAFSGSAQIAITGGNFELVDNSIINNSPLLAADITNGNGTTVYQTRAYLHEETESSQLTGSNVLTVNNSTYGYNLKNVYTQDGHLSVWLPSSSTQASGTFRSNEFPYVGVVDEKYTNVLTWAGPQIFYLDKGDITIDGNADGSVTAHGYDVNGVPVTSVTKTGIVITQTDSNTATAHTVVANAADTTLYIENINVATSSTAFSFTASNITLSGQFNEQSSIEGAVSAIAAASSNVLFEDIAIDLAGKNAIVLSDTTKVTFTSSSSTMSSNETAILFNDTASSFTMETGTLDLSQSSASFNDDGKITVKGGNMKTTSDATQFFVYAEDGTQLYQTYAIFPEAAIEGEEVALSRSSSIACDGLSISYDLTQSDTIDQRVWLWLPRARVVTAQISGVDGYLGKTSEGVYADGTDKTNKLSLEMFGTVQITATNTVQVDGRVDGDYYIYDTLTAEASNTPEWADVEYTWYAGTEDQPLYTELMPTDSEHPEVFTLTEYEYRDYVTVTIRDANGIYEGEKTAVVGPIKAEVTGKTQYIDDKAIQGRMQLLQPGWTARMQYNVTVLSGAAGLTIDDEAILLASSHSLRDEQNFATSPIEYIYADTYDTIKSGIVVNKVYGPGEFHYYSVGDAQPDPTIMSYNIERYDTLDTVATPVIQASRVWDYTALMDGPTTKVDGWDFHPWYNTIDCIDSADDYIAPGTPYYVDPSDTYKNFYGYWTAPVELDMTSVVNGSRQSNYLTMIDSTKSNSKNNTEALAAKGTEKTRAGDKISYTASYTNTNNANETVTFTFLLPVKDDDYEQSFDYDDPAPASARLIDSAGLPQETTIQEIDGVSYRTWTYTFEDVAYGQTKEYTIYVEPMSTGLDFNNEQSERELTVGCKVDYTPVTSRMTHAAGSMKTYQTYSVANPVVVTYVYTNTSYTDADNALYVNGAGEYVPGPNGKTCAISCPAPTRDAYVGDTVVLYNENAYGLGDNIVFNQQTGDSRVGYNYYPDPYCQGDLMKEIVNISNNTTVYVHWSNKREESIQGW